MQAVVGSARGDIEFEQVNELAVKWRERSVRQGQIGAGAGRRSEGVLLEGLRC